MKENQEREALPQQQVPFNQYYPVYPHEDEINLVDLFRVLAKRKLTIIGLTVLTTLLAVGYALSLPSVYKSQSVLLRPTLKQVEFFNYRGAITVNQAFNTFKRHLYTDQQQVLVGLNLKDAVLEQGSEKANENRLVSGAKGRFTLEEVREVKRRKNFRNKSAQDNTFYIPRITVIFQGPDPDLNSEMINRLVKIASDNTKNELFENVSEKINTQKVQLVEGINQARKIYLAGQRDDIDRLQIKSKFDQQSIRNQIVTLRNKAIVARKDRIENLSEHAIIARDAGLMLGSETETEGKLVEVNIERQGALYLRGEKVLLSEVEQLKKRKSDDAFIPGLRGLDAKLSLLKLDLENKIKDLTVRGKKDHLFNGLRSKEFELQKLQDLDFTRFQLGSVMTVVSEASPSKKPINKRKRKLIVALGVLLGLMIGILGAFFLNFLENQKQDEE